MAYRRTADVLPQNVQSVPVGEVHFAANQDGTIVVGIGREKYTKHFQLQAGEPLAMYRALGELFAPGTQVPITIADAA